MESPDDNTALIKLSAGFTILEILLVVALIAIVAGIGIPFYYSFVIRNNIDLAEEIVYEAYTKSQIKAQAGDRDTTWGTYIEDGKATVFSGSSYATRNVTHDEIFSFSENISVSGLVEVVFSKLTGETNITGSTVLTSSAGDTRTITINEKGAITFSDPEEIYDVEYTQLVTSDWITGYCADVTVATNSVEPIIWEVFVPLDTYPTNGVAYSVWNASWFFADDTLVASGVVWNNEVSAGNSQQFGYCANRFQSDSGQVSYHVSVTTDWGAGYCANVDITTESLTPVTWQVEIPLTTSPTNGIPSTVWNANWSFSDQTLTAGGLSWNESVSASGPRQFGYCAFR